MDLVYLDNNATTRVAPEVLEEMLPYLKESYGNPSSLHRLGMKASTAIKEARERAASFLRCRESELIFTSCGTESNNHAIRGVLEAAPEKRHVVTTAVEHPSVLNVLKSMEKLGYRVSYLAVDSEGRLDLGELRDALGEDTALVSIMYANNETGVVFPMEEIAGIVKSRGIPLHVDAIQAVGKVPVDLSKLGVDLLAVSGHKLHAPKGVGLLFMRRGTRVAPIMTGGGQEKGRRSGTENVPYIVALGKALEIAAAYLESGVEETRRLRDKLEAGILSAISSATVNGARDPRLPNTSNISFEGIEGEAVLLLLDEKGICASSGSACTTGAIEPSHVLKAMGASTAVAHGSIRFSLSRYTTEGEIDYMLEELPPIIQRLRGLSNAC